MRTNLFAVSKNRESDTASVELKWIQSFVRFLKNIITVLKLDNIVSFACNIYGEVFTDCYGVYLQIPSVLMPYLFNASHMLKGVYLNISLSEAKTTNQQRRRRAKPPFFAVS